MNSEIHMKNEIPTNWIWKVLSWAVVMGLSLIWILPLNAASPNSYDEGSPWGFSCSSEWFGDYPQFNRLMANAGARWIRAFYEWNSVQPQPNQWNWTASDALVANCRKNNIHLAGVFMYLTTWVSADGSTRRFPLKDMQPWRDYVEAATSRYQKDILYWEVGNEWNGSFGPGCTPEVYAAMVKEAYLAAKKVDPNIKIGLSVANFDVAYLDAAIKAGAANHFDYIAVHPYENVASLADGGEMGYLSLAGNLRDMMQANKQRPDIPLWITEFGYQVAVAPHAQSEAQQANILIKSSVLSLAQGFTRLCWFEPRGPAYGKGTDHGLIRPDWSLRPGYHAFKTMTTLLGPTPRYAGWLKLGENGYSFLFEGQGGPVLIGWTPPHTGTTAHFAEQVNIIDATGKVSKLAGNVPLSLTDAPVFVTDLPIALVEQARTNLHQPYPWGRNYAQAKEVSIRLSGKNLEDGLKQINLQTTAVVNLLDHSVRRSNFAHGGEGRYVYFRVDPQFVPYGTRELEITVVAKRTSTDKTAGMTLSYESLKGYTNVPDGWWTVPTSDQWQEHTWRLSDANFVGQWGWNFRLDAVGSPHEYLIKEVCVRKK